MKKHFLVLFLGATILAIHPLFAIGDTESEERSKSGTARKLPQGSKGIDGAFSYTYDPMHTKWKIETNQSIDENVQENFLLPIHTRNSPLWVRAKDSNKSPTKFQGFFIPANSATVVFSFNKWGMKMEDSPSK